MCVQGALTASARTVQAYADIIGKVKGGVESKEVITIINPSSQQTTFANTAYFGICQLALNPDIELTQQEVVSMFKFATAASLLMENTAAASGTPSPEPTNSLNELLNNEVGKKVQDATKSIEAVERGVSEGQ